MSPRSLAPVCALPPAAGVGLKPQHYAEALAARTEGAESWPNLWFEVHPQNYFAQGGASHDWLRAFADIAPLSFHSVGLSLGSADGARADELDHLARLCADYAPACVSDHLSWSGLQGDRLPDLLPVPYTQEALDHMTAQIAHVQDRLKRPILIENPSRLLAFAHDEMAETDFIRLLCDRAGCGLLLDINNIVVSSVNLGFDPVAWLDAIDPALVGEIHMAGHAREVHGDRTLLIDDHGSEVGQEAWDLCARFLQRAGPRPVLIEWDTRVPDFSVLLGQARRAQDMIDAAPSGCVAAA